VQSPAVITIDDTELEVVDTFTYLRSTMSSTLSLDAEISSRIAKASTVMTKLSKRVWKNDLLNNKTKLCIYQACILSTLLYGSVLDDLCQAGAATQQLSQLHLLPVPHEVAGQSPIPGSWSTLVY